MFFQSGRSESITPTDLSQDNPADGAIGASAYPDSGEDLALPTQDEVVKKTEKITKKIQELLVSAQQDGKQDRCAVVSLSEFSFQGLLWSVSVEKVSCCKAANFCNHCV